MKTAQWSSQAWHGSRPALMFVCYGKGPDRPRAGTAVRCQVVFDRVRFHSNGRLLLCACLGSTIETLRLQLVIPVHDNGTVKHCRAC
ncbi:hypothetical protein AAFF_G00025960 [Aldrovandia affinis]|uniref:Uncharacterized protein n=1 Tax=Aldrovandia affinis TaxID=143900 RepID=A0AAD7S4Z2_9TELE|nr:hypothetical protein AAFF_G00025960 [Aldrovandia affinis]